MYGYDYDSPIKQIMGEMKTQYEDNAIKVVQEYGFDVDKDELAKALAYDRNQYKEGFRNGFSAGIDALVEELNNIFTYRHDMAEIQQIAEQIKEQKNE